MLLAGMVAALALLQPADLSEALRPCEAASSFEAASECMVGKFGRERVQALRVDRDHDPAVYRAVGLAFRLHDPSSPVAASMAASGYYNPDVAPAVLIVMAQSRVRGDGRLVDQPDLRTLVAFANQDAEERRRNWPPASLGTRVDLSRCPDTPQRRAPGAVCVEQGGRLSLVTPLPAKPGWLGAPVNKKAD